MVVRDDVQLTKEELQAEKAIEAGSYTPVPNLEAEKKRLSKLVKASKQRKRISIRVYESDLEAIKQKAEKL